MSEKDLKNEIIRKKSSKVLQVQEKFLSLHPQSEMMANRFDSLAQQVEHNTFNVGVLGSSPKRITRIKSKTTETADNQSLSAVFSFIFHLHFGAKWGNKIWTLHWDVRSASPVYAPSMQTLRNFWGRFREGQYAVDLPAAGMRIVFWGQSLILQLLIDCSLSIKKTLLSLSAV